MPGTKALLMMVFFAASAPAWATPPLCTNSVIDHATTSLAVQAGRRALVPSRRRDQQVSQEIPLETIKTNPSKDLYVQSFQNQIFSMRDSLGWKDRFLIFDQLINGDAGLFGAFGRALAAADGDVSIHYYTRGPQVNKMSFMGVVGQHSRRLQNMRDAKVQGVPFRKGVGQYMLTLLQKYATSSQSVAEINGQTTNILDLYPHDQSNMSQSLRLSRAELSEDQNRQLANFATWLHEKEHPERAEFAEFLLGLAYPTYANMAAQQKLANLAGRDALRAQVSWNEDGSLTSPGVPATRFSASGRNVNFLFAARKHMADAILLTGARGNLPIVETKNKGSAGDLAPLLAVHVPVANAFATAIGRNAQETEVTPIDVMTMEPVEFTRAVDRNVAALSKVFLKEKEFELQYEAIRDSAISYGEKLLTTLRTPAGNVKINDQNELGTIEHAMQLVYDLKMDIDHIHTLVSIPAEIQLSRLDTRLRNEPALKSSVDMSAEIAKISASRQQISMRTDAHFEILTSSLRRLRTILTFYAPSNAEESSRNIEDIMRTLDF